jgi:UPF0271 protein
MRIDLNCDLGEAIGAGAIEHDRRMMAYVTSVNVACGAHAGDPDTMRATVRSARAAGVSVGAHPGYADREGFGRRDVELTSEEIENLVLVQIGALAAVARVEGMTLAHVKPHGALCRWSRCPDRCWSTQGATPVSTSCRRCSRTARSMRTARSSRASGRAR